jgi:hypothetical protein
MGRSLYGMKNVTNFQSGEENLGDLGMDGRILKLIFSSSVTERNEFEISLTNTVIKNMGP